LSVIGYRLSVKEEWTERPTDRTTDGPDERPIDRKTGRPVS